MKLFYKDKMFTSRRINGTENWQIYSSTICLFSSIYSFIYSSKRSSQNEGILSSFQNKVVDIGISYTESFTILQGQCSEW